MPYAFAAVSVAAAVGLKLAFNDLVGRHTPFLIFPFAVIASAWWGGLAGGLFATVLSAALAWWYMSTAGPGPGGGTGAALRVALFVLQGAAISFMAHYVARITRRVTESARERTESLLRLVLRGRPVVLYTCDQNLRITWVYQAHGPMVPSDVLGRRDDEIPGMDAAEELMAFKREVLQSGKGARREIRMTIHGREEVYDVVAEPLRSADGEVRGLTIAAMDITDRMETEEALRMSRERLDLIVGSSEIGFWYCDLPFDKLVWSVKTREHFGLSADEPVTIHTFYDRIHPDDREPTRQAIERAIADKTVYDTYYRTISQTGQIRWVRAVGRAFYDAAGDPARFDGITIDTTEHKRREEERVQLLEQARVAHAAAEHRARQLRMLSEASVSINASSSIEETLQAVTQRARLIIRAHQCVTSLTSGADFAQTISARSMSEKYAEWSGFDEPISGAGIYSLVCRTNAPMRMTQAELEAHPEFKRFSDFADRHPPLRGWLAAPLTSRSGKNLGVIQLSDKEEGEFSENDQAVLMQLAQMASIAIENAQYLQAATDARAEAEAANRMKDQFLATLSHELRTPLNAILGWAQLLRTGRMTEDDIRSGLETIERNSRAQGQLIEDLLDVSRIISGKLRLDIHPVEVPRIIDAAMGVVAPAAEAKQIRLTREVSDVDEPIHGDPVRLQQVIWNLLSNALKFTPAGGQVTVRARRDINEIEIAVTDSGSGIKPDFLPFVFDRFRQADASTTRRHGGLGLGLSIVRQLVEMHGGSVRALSEGEGKGATFLVRLPFGRAARIPAAQPEQSAHDARTLAASSDHDLVGARLLLVEDEADARELVARILRSAGAHVRSVDAAADALKCLNDWKPDLLVSDIGMPEMDGNDLVRALRSRSDAFRTLPAIALTAFARPEEQKQAIDAGFNLHLAKPIESAQLIAAIANLLHLQEHPAPSAID